MAAGKQAAEDEPGAGEAGATPRLARRVLLAVLALAVAGGAAGGAYHYFLAGAVQSEAAAPVAAKPPAFLDLPEVMVNLAVGDSERPQYLKVRAVLELEDAALAPKVQPFLPRVIDAFQVFLRELRPADLEGSAGIYRLREELTRRVNAAIAPLSVNAVLFKELVIQ